MYGNPTSIAHILTINLHFGHNLQESNYIITSFFSTHVHMQLCGLSKTKVLPVQGHSIQIRIREYIDLWCSLIFIPNIVIAYTLRSYLSTISTYNSHLNSHFYLIESGNWSGNHKWESYINTTLLITSNWFLHRGCVLALLFPTWLWWFHFFFFVNIFLDMSCWLKY